MNRGVSLKVMQVINCEQHKRINIPARYIWNLQFLKSVPTGTWINSLHILRYIFLVTNILYIEIVLPQNIIP